MCLSQLRCLVSHAHPVPFHHPSFASHSLTLLFTLSLSLCVSCRMWWSNSIGHFNSQISYALLFYTCFFVAVLLLLLILPAMCLREWDASKRHWLLNEAWVLAVHVKLYLCPRMGAILFMCKRVFFMMRCHHNFIVELMKIWSHFSRLSIQMMSARLQLKSASFHAKMT